MIKASHSRLHRLEFVYTFALNFRKHSSAEHQIEFVILFEGEIVMVYVHEFSASRPFRPPLWYSWSLLFINGSTNPEGTKSIHTHRAILSWDKENINNLR